MLYYVFYQLKCCSARRQWMFDGLIWKADEHIHRDSWWVSEKKKGKSNSGRKRNWQMMGCKLQWVVLRDREQNKEWGQSLDHMKKRQTKMTERKFKIRHSVLVMCCIYSIYRLLWGRVLKPLCGTRWIGVNHCVFIGTQTHRHQCAPSPESYHYPSLHPLFGISRPDRSRPIALSHSRPAYLSLSHPLSYLIFLYLPLSFSHRISPLSLSQPPHNSLLPTNCISFKIT